MLASRATMKGLAAARDAREQENVHVILPEVLGRSAHARQVAIRGYVAKGFEPVRDGVETQLGASC